MGAKTFPQFPFAGGIDQATETAYLDPSQRQVSIVIGSFPKLGAIGKRLGIGHLSNAVGAPNALPSPTTGQRVTSWNRADVTVMGSSGLYNYSQAEDKLTAISALPPCYPLRRPVATAQGNVPPVVFDLPYNGRLLRIALSTDATGDIFGTVYDADSGDIVLEPTVIRAVDIGYTQFVVNGFYLANAPANEQAAILIDNGHGTLFLRYYNPATNSFQINVALLTGYSNLDACPYVGDPAGGFIVTYTTTVGDTRSVIMDYWLPNATLAATKAITFDNGNFPGPSFVSATYGENVWIAYGLLTSGTAYYLIQYSGDHTFSLDYGGPQQVTQIPSGAILSGTCIVGSSLFIAYQTAITLGLSASSFAGGWVVQANNSSVTGSGTTPAGYVTAMRPFVVSGQVYQVFLYLDAVPTAAGSFGNLSEQVTMYLLQWQSLAGNPATTNQALPVATIAKTIVSASSFFFAATGGHQNLMSQTALAATRFACGLNTIGIDVGAAAGSQGPSFTAEFFFDAAHTSLLYQSQELGSDLHISGGVPFVFDGQIAFEDNFFSYPEQASAALTGDSNTSFTGQFIYAVCYAFVDSAGLIHRSAPYFTDPVNPFEPSQPPGLTGTTNAGIGSGLYGPSGTLNTPAQVFGSINLTSDSFGGTGFLMCPQLIFGTDMTTSGLYGSGGTLTGTTISLVINGSGSPKTLTFTTPQCLNAQTVMNTIAGYFSTSGTQIVCMLDNQNRLIILNFSEGPDASISTQTSDTAATPLGYNGGRGCPTWATLGGDVGYAGNNGQFTSGSAGGHAPFADTVANTFTGNTDITVTGSPHLGNNVYGNAATFVSSSVVDVSGSSLVADAAAADSWGAACYPSTKVLWLNVNGAGLTPLVLNGANLKNSADLCNAIMAQWPALKATIVNEGIALTSVDTGPGQSIVVGAGSANPLLGLTPGTYSGATTTLTLTLNGVTTGTLTLNVATNAATQAAFFAALQSEYSPTLVPSINGQGNLVLTWEEAAAAASIEAVSGSALPILGYTAGQTESGAAGSLLTVLTIPALSATWRDNSEPGHTYVEIYRTVSNGSTFYLEDRVPCSATSAPNIIWDGPGGDPEVSDAELQTSTLLYTTGGVLPNINPPTFLLQIVHNGRVMGVDETLQQVWPSQPFMPGTAPGFSGSLVISFAEDGDITAIGSMDGKFICWKGSSIWIMYGTNGPAVTGQGSDWTTPQRLQSNVGAVGQFGLCSTDVGIFFQSSTGIYLLGRDLSVTFIGAQVMDLLTIYPLVTSATLVPSATQVRFTCSNASASVTVVYDYLFRDWTTHSYSWLSAPVQSACLSASAPQQFTLISQDGQLWQEHLPTDAQPWMDSDVNGGLHFVPTTIGLAPIRTGLQGYLRCLFAQLKTVLQAGNCCSGLQIQLSINDDPSIVQTAVYPAEDLVSLAIPGQVAMYVGAGYNQAFSYSFTVSDVDSGVAGQSGQGARFIGLGLALEQLGPRYPFLPVGARA